MPALRCGLPRRLAAVCYDAMLVLALLMLATVPVLFLTGGEGVPPGNHSYQIYLLATAFTFHGGFWTHGGQTLGMRAWRIRVQQRDGSAITWPQAAVRYVGAILSWLLLGGGFLWQLVDREGLTLHDRLSHTELVIVPKPSRGRH